MSGSRTTAVIDSISQMLRDGRLSPGDRLPPESELTQELGISRTPLREGIQALVLLGVLETRQGDGTYVTDLRAESLFKPLMLASEIQARSNPLDILATRRVLEVEVAGLAALHRTDEGIAAAQRALDAAAEIIAKGWPIDHERILDTDMAFHSALASMSGNGVMIGLLNSLGARTTRARLGREQSEEGVSQRTHAEHCAIFSAVVDGDVTRARAHMANHLFGVEEFARSRGFDNLD